MRDQDYQRSLGHLGAPSVEQHAASALGKALHAGRAFLRAGAVVLALAAAGTSESFAQAAGQDATPIKSKHVDVSREGATQLPRSEGDQALVDGWPLYRTERGQQAFNDTIATLKATEGTAPAQGAFKGCASLECNLSLPALTADGWIPPGRLWVSPTEYVLFVHSPRLRDGQTYRRRPDSNMRYFVYHEFHNSTRNTDPFDTISSHSGSVYVSFYMSKQWTDARGRRFVIVVQVAPHDVVSYHATDKGSAGPGMEVAKNYTDPLEPLQGLAGILVATIVKTATPQLQVVNHGGTEGLPMLTMYESRLKTLRARAGEPTVALPFVAAQSQRVAAATTGRLTDLIASRAASPIIPVAERGIMPSRTAISASEPASVRSASLAADYVPVLVEPIRPAVRPASRASSTGQARPATKPASLADDDDTDR